MEAYREMIEQAKNGTTFTKLSYRSIDVKSPGYYEDYLVLKNKEYSAYRQTIEQKTLENFPGLAEKKKWAESPTYAAPELRKKKNNKNNTPGITSQGFEDRSIVPYLVLFPVIFLAFIVSDLGVFNSKTGTTGTGSTNGTSGSHFFYWG